MSDQPETDCGAPNCCKGDQWPQCQGGRETPAQEATHYDDQQTCDSCYCFTD